MHPIASPTEFFAEIAFAEIALPLLTLFVATLTSLAAILDFFTFAPLTEIFVNRHYGFSSFSPEDCQRPGRTRIPFCGQLKMSRHERAAGSVEEQSGSTGNHLVVLKGSHGTSGRPGAVAHSGTTDPARHSMPK